jgi:hypothetical protein
MQDWRSVSGGKDEEPAAVFRPGGLAAGVVNRGDPDGLAARQFPSESIVGGCGRGHRRPHWFLLPANVDDPHDQDQDNCDKTKRPGECADIERPASHQWNICAEPG